MSQNPYDAPQYDSVGPAAESEPGAPIRLDRSRLYVHASAFGHGALAYLATYLAVVAWITFAIQLLSLRDRSASLDVENCAYIQALAPILPGLLIWAIALRNGLANRNSPAVRWHFWTIFLAMIAGTMAGAFLLDD